MAGPKHQVRQGNSALYVRGLRSPITIASIKCLVWYFQPKGIFMSETMITFNKIGELREMLTSVPGELMTLNSKLL